MPADLVLPSLGGGASEAPSCDGYVYASSPFAPSALAGTCVPESHFRYDIIRQDDAPGTVCPGEPEVGGQGGGVAGSGP